ncbi:MAG TPA: GntR family transcriptional regulator [Gemmatimonadales bacterium]|jgi:DNA-binding GntR family transcriptional regulator
MIHRSPLRDEVYRQILDGIQRGDSAPGTRLRDTALASSLGVSRTPVREALLRLARDGVLDADMGRGFRVPPLDSREVGDTGQILGALEALALESSPELPPELLDRLAELDRKLEHTRGDATRCADLEDEWHQVLLERCPNRQLLDLIATHRQISRRYLLAYLRDSTPIALSTLPHQKIGESLRKGDRPTAVRLLLQHWRRGIEELQAWTAR